MKGSPPIVACKASSGPPAMPTIAGAHLRPATIGSIRHASFGTNTKRNTATISVEDCAGVHRDRKSSSLGSSFPQMGLVG